MSTKRTVFKDAPQKLPEEFLSVAPQDGFYGRGQANMVFKRENIKKLELSDDFHVYLDVKNKLGRQRFDRGRLGDLPTTPVMINIDEPDLMASDSLTYEVRIVDLEIHKIKAEGYWLDVGRKSLLEIKSENLGQRITRLEIPSFDDAENMPVLLLNRDLFEIRKTPIFKSLVAMPAFETILQRVFFDPHVEVERDGQSWADRWCRFACVVSGVAFEDVPGVDKDSVKDRTDFLEDINNRIDIDLFIDRVVTSVADQNNFDHAVKGFLGA